MVDYMVIVAPLVFMLLDIVTGYAKGVAQKSVSSSVMRQGLWHKFALIILLVVAYLVSYLSTSTFSFPYEVPAFQLTALYVVVMEITSILENIAIINPEIKGSKFFSVFHHTETQLDNDNATH